MTNVWGPIGSKPSGGMWSAQVHGEAVWVTVGDVTTSHALGEMGPTRVQRGLFRSSVSWEAPEKVRLRGMAPRSARKFHDAVERERRRVVENLRVAALVEEFSSLTADVVEWARGFFAAASAHRAERGWLTRELLSVWQDKKPSQRFGEVMALADLGPQRDALNGEALESIDLWNAELSDYVQRWNESFLGSESAEHRSFFDNVESSPLTDEQTRAVVCLDNRVQLVAAAGSGKTSVMIAKAGYAVYRGFVAPEQILMLAFNSRAAGELQQRVTERLTPLGLAADRIQARTFHAFGLSVIGQATGRKPRLAPWIEQNADVAKLAQIVDLLRDGDPLFRTQWDLFRIVFGRDATEDESGEPEPDARDAKLRRDGFQTLAGEVVKSQGERLIADWLYYNGVEYVYERPYEVDTVTADHSQYQPDFYYPAAGLYHEHFALDANGEAPRDFVGYLDGVRWKRELHAQHGTAMIETTMAQLWGGTAFKHLSDELASRGVTLDPNPDRPSFGQPPIDNERLVATFRSFMVHAKSNQLSGEELLERLATPGQERHLFRHELFLHLYSRIREGWEYELATHGSIDFEDMLNFAADHVESGAYSSPFRLVMVDEMQDASVARARLVRALVATPGRHLFAVGDDWQSINRFAGADLTVMTAFEEWFGAGEVLRLQRTFRCPQSICNVSSTFAMKNPGQISKSVRSSTDEYSPSIVAIAAPDDEAVPGVVRKYLGDLNSRIAAGTVPPGRGGKASVFILGRYRHHKSVMPSDAVASWPHLNIRFSTIHASKGLEADYVLIPGLVRNKSAFPSRTADDPALRLAMPAREPFPHAEERRLFYVALTRARRAVTLLTVQHRESSFVSELVKEHHIPYRTSGGVRAAVIHCTTCETGVLVPRLSKHGKFYGCSNFPKCRQTMREVDVPKPTHP